MPSAWTQHLARYRASHPNMSMKQCMVEASATYRQSAMLSKKKRAAKAEAASSSRPSANPWIAHVQAYRASHACSYAEALQRAKATYRGRHFPCPAGAPGRPEEWVFSFLALKQQGAGGWGIRDFYITVKGDLVWSKLDGTCRGTMSINEESHIKFNQEFIKVGVEFVSADADPPLNWKTPSPFASSIADIAHNIIHTLDGKSKRASQERRIQFSGQNAAGKEGHVYLLEIHNVYRRRWKVQ